MLDSVRQLIKDLQDLRDRLKDIRYELDTAFDLARDLADGIGSVIDDATEEALNNERLEREEME